MRNNLCKRALRRLRAAPQQCKLSGSGPSQRELPKSPRGARNSPPNAQVHSLRIHAKVCLSREIGRLTTSLRAWYQACAIRDRRSLQKSILTKLRFLAPPRLPVAGLTFQNVGIDVQNGYAYVGYIYTGNMAIYDVSDIANVRGDSRPYELLRTFPGAGMQLRPSPKTGQRYRAFRAGTATSRRGTRRTPGPPSGGSGPAPQRGRKHCADSKIVTYCAFCTSSTSMVISTSSPTRNPPLSSTAFQMRPKSLRSIRAFAVAPRLHSPLGSLISGVTEST